MGALKAGCDRSREWISLELDGELSELERARLHRHLELCAGCARHASVVRTVTREIRAAPVEAPAARGPLSQRRSSVPALQLLAAAAAVAMAVGTGALAGSLPISPRAFSPALIQAMPPPPYSPPVAQHDDLALRALLS
jgi:anti-sigma factor RsiW